MRSTLAPRSLPSRSSASRPLRASVTARTGASARGRRAECGRAPAFQLSTAQVGGRRGRTPVAARGEQAADDAQRGRVILGQQHVQGGQRAGRRRLQARALGAPHSHAMPSLAELACSRCECPDTSGPDCRSRPKSQVYLRPGGPETLRGCQALAKKRGELGAEAPRLATGDAMAKLVNMRGLQVRALFAHTAAPAGPGASDRAPRRPLLRTSATAPTRSRRRSAWTRSWARSARSLRPATP